MLQHRDQHGWDGKHGRSAILLDQLQRLTPVRFVEAFQNRFESPEGWDKALAEYGESLVKRSKKPDETISKDIQAAKAASKTTEVKKDEKHKGYSAEEINAMSDADFNKHFPGSSRYVM